MEARESIIRRLERRRLESQEDLIAKQQMKDRIRRMDQSVDKLRLKVDNM